jgi:SAM-dependent methyltransferase
LSAPYVRPTDTVLDFGCAGGGMLGGLPGARKIGVEISDVERTAAMRDHGVEAYKTLAEVPDGIVDVVVSNHTLEHLAGLYDALCQLKPKLKPDGLLVLVLPIDDWRAQRTWDSNDINRHLYMDAAQPGQPTRGGRLPASRDADHSPHAYARVR